MNFKRLGPPGTLPLILLGGLLLFYTWALLHYLVPVTGGTDQNGYHTCARTFNLEGSSTGNRSINSNSSVRCGW
ncbi:MAG: hypothetical protein L6W00_19430 [Lentisphaeria bacterium]|nr:MAG: hypothetical protein L6W00_19430 [Lentisphaeria bacterium]